MGSKIKVTRECQKEKRCAFVVSDSQRDFIVRKIQVIIMKDWLGKWKSPTFNSMSINQSWNSIK